MQCMRVCGCLEGPEEGILGCCELSDLGMRIQPQVLLVEQQTLSTNELSLQPHNRPVKEINNSEEQRREVSSVWPYWVEDQRDPMTPTHAPKYITRVLMRGLGLNRGSEACIIKSAPSRCGSVHHWLIVWAPESPVGCSDKSKL